MRLRFAARRGTRIEVLAGETTERRMHLPERPSNVVGWLDSDYIVVMAKRTRTL